MEKKRQSDKFKKLARELECDEDEKRWDERLKKGRQRQAGEAELSRWKLSIG